MAKCLECILSLFKTESDEGNVKKASPTLDELKTLFKDVNIATIDELIDFIKVLLERKKAQKIKQDNPSTSSESVSTTEKPPWIKIGAKFLTFVNNRMEKIGEAVDLFHSDGEGLKEVSEILEEVGQTHWTVAGLSMVGYLLSKIEKMSDNQADCFKLLQKMFDLATHIRKAKHLLREEEKMLRNALVLIVKGSIMCASQLDSKKLFRFLKSSQNSQKLKSLRSDIKDCITMLQLTEPLYSQQVAERVAISQPDYPAQAVGIEEQVKEVKDWLQKTTTEKSLRVAIIYGFGGIGKTILATAVYARFNLNGYNHTRVVMYTDPDKNDIEKMQVQILKDAFPKYNSGREINLRNTEEGKECLKRAFQEENNPVFLFIDNALREEDLRELLPKDLEGLGKHIRLLLTTRNLAATNMFNKSLCHEYLVKPLQKSDAMKILCNKTENLDRIKDDVESILKICGGVPIVLEIVGGHLKNQGYKADKCREILNALEKGHAIKEQGLSECMVDFVFKKFENFTQEAFLDICCFFYGMNRRHVEYTVGSLALKALEDAALITFKVVGNVKIVVVHDVILAKGQNMAGSTRIKDIESFKAAVKQERLEKIKGIQFCFGKDHSSFVFEKDHLNSMGKSLRVFILGPKISVSSRSDMSFPELRFLHLDEDIPFVPFHFEALKELAVYKGPLLKEGVSIYKLPKSVRSITATAANNEEWTNGEESKPLQVVPNSSLEELNLVRLWRMKTLPEGFQNFAALKILNLDTWDNMEELPVVICDLPRLGTLTLGLCDRLKCLPPSFKRLTSLEYLALNGCSRLKELPSSFVELKNLRYLNLESCSSLMKLPSTFGQLTALQSLNLKACSFLKEVPGFEQLRGLKYLNAKYCPKLRRNFYNAPSDLLIELEEEETESEEEYDGN